MSETTVPVATAPSTTPAPRARRARAVLRGVQILLALFFGAASALPKLIAHPAAVESFDRIGWGAPGMYTIGALELAGAIALLIPALQSVGAASLAALMVGAFITQVTVFDGENAATPLIVFVPLAVIAWARRGTVTELAGLVRRQG
ncbi:DoxX family protein [Streptomyces acidiscabies]|uniref:Membrane protein n=1 Tax=Streptomyces acidiscabies TaxID=42234 RepID=A0A0L0KKR7_9ACTN|nr:DoxX family protein [Streptomyces acidiscabies]KND38421.1 membrane protein [Streptomyces acidiscabies]